MPQRGAVYRSPNPNGYQRFLQATTIVPTLDSDHSSHQALAAFVSECDQAYKLVESGLRTVSEVPVEESKTWWNQHMRQELPRLKRLTQALTAKAELAKMEGRIGDALDAEMEAYRFSAAIGRGGLSPDFLYSMSCKGIILKACQSLVLNLTPLQRSQLLKLVRETEGEGETADAVAQRTLRWRRATFGIKGDLNEWQQTVEDAWQSKSWAPLRATSRSILAGKRAVYEQEYLHPFYQRLSPAQDPDPPRDKPAHPTD
jgi:hypothetical protein